MDNIQIKVVDDSALDAFDRLLDPRARRRIIQSAKRAAAKPIREEASERAPVGKPRVWRRMRFPGGSLRGWLAKAKTGIKITRNKNVYVLAGVRRKNNEGVDPMDAFYAHWVEDGHRMPRGIRNAAPKPYLAPAARAKADDAMQAFNKRFVKRVGKELDKVRNRAGKR